MLLRVAAAVLVLAGVCLAGPRVKPFTANATALDNYVWTADATYKYEELPNSTFEGVGYKGYLLNMTSQTWLTAADTDHPVWWHYVVVVVPVALSHHDVGELYITGGSNHMGIPDGTGEDELLCIALALTTETICTVLFQVPNEPIMFTAEQPPKSRSEDALIAYAWNVFYQNTSQAYWLPRLPMTKAAVRAMDTTTDYVQKKFGHEINKYVVAGASKRGWTTWTTAAVDDRVIAQVPIVMDLLNLVKNMHHFYRNFGGWTFAFKDYYAFDFTGHIDGANTSAMAEIIDPYVYRNRWANMPKLVVDSTGDEFFQPDDNHYWWDDMPGELHLLMVQNAEHSLVTGLPEVVTGVSAFLLGVLNNYPRPTMSWNFTTSYNGGGISVTVSQPPRKVIVRYADTLDGVRRDWRLITGQDPCPTVSVEGGCIHPVLWASQEALQTGDLTWEVSFNNPADGWRAFLIEVEFPGASVLPFIFTTQVNIIPNTYPFPDCHGEECKGTLL